MRTTAGRLRTATAEDVEFLARVVLVCNEDRYAARGGWDRQAFHRGLLEDAADQVAGGAADSTTYVVESDGEQVGRLRVVRTPGLVEIAGVQILPHEQGRGLGTAVVRHVLAEAGGAGLPVELDVEHDNPRARLLYERLGFVETGARTDDGIRMAHRGPADGIRMAHRADRG